MDLFWKTMLSTIVTASGYAGAGIYPAGRKLGGENTIGNAAGRQKPPRGLLGHRHKLPGLPVIAACPYIGGGTEQKARESDGTLAITSLEPVGQNMM